MRRRPRLKLKYSATDKLIEVLCLLALAALWIWVKLSYTNLPQTIPTHFNVNGEADDFGSKDSIFTLPIVATFIYVLMTIVNRVPHLFNHLEPITPENAFRLYTSSTRMLRYMKFIIILIFGTIIYFIINH